VKITFDVGKSSAVFHREPFLGGAYLVIDGQKTTLASPANVTTSFTYELSEQWSVSHAGHSIEVGKVRPRILGGLRRSTYVVRVDGEEITTTRGF
jgi:hypothetical protein